MKVSDHVQLGGSRKSTIQSNHHEKTEDVPSRPSSVASSFKHQPHSRTTSVSTLRDTPVQRVHPTFKPVPNPYGDHQSVRVVKNVREFVTIFGATHKTPPPTPLAGIPRLSNSCARSPIADDTFHPVVKDHSVQSSRKSSVASIGQGVQINKAASRKSTVSSCQSSRKSTASNIHDAVIIGGNVAAPRSRQSTITQDNVNEHYDSDTTELIHVADMRRLFENFGPAHLPEYASAPTAYIH
uniref:Uncharacterized protein n=1 Tax=Caenorhabditis japonica TaxID=281687 RepID=A0A8R1DVM3_CAEJA